MTEIIPAILAKDFDEAKEKITAVEQYVNWVQLDVADGHFAPSRTWGDPQELKEYDPGVFIEAHLMVAEPERVIDAWLESGVKRIYFHYEATSEHEALIRRIQSAGLEAGVALLAETPLSAMKLFDELADAVLLFSGHLGFYGGEFQSDIIIQKISTLRAAHPDITIGVDGGMNPETAKEAVAAGANAIVSGSYIFGSENIKDAIQELQSALFPPP
jgi:ribulose-phosphate 3-epimerase